LAESSVDRVDGDACEARATESEGGGSTGGAKLPVPPPMVTLPRRLMCTDIVKRFTTFVKFQYDWKRLFP
jgi:hypothetical protein